MDGCEEGCSWEGSLVVRFSPCFFVVSFVGCGEVGRDGDPDT